MAKLMTLLSLALATASPARADGAPRARLQLEEALAPAPSPPRLALDSYDRTGRALVATGVGMLATGGALLVGGLGVLYGTWEAPGNGASWAYGLLAGSAASAIVGAIVLTQGRLIRWRARRIAAGMQVMSDPHAPVGAELAVAGRF
jgi:hypothetical protein